MQSRPCGSSNEESNIAFVRAATDGAMHDGHKTASKQHLTCTMLTTNGTLAMVRMKSKRGYLFSFYCGSLEQQTS